MKSLEESVVIAMDGSDKELFPFLPYILKDTWEIGSDPEVIIKIITDHFKKPQKLAILDLGCGKGAVSIKIARKFGCRCRGIDAIPEFISEAKKKAEEYEVLNLCQFKIGDIREKVARLPGYNVIILGSIGPVLGNYQATLKILKRNLAPNGIIIIDDGYIEDHKNYKHSLLIKKREILDQISKAGMKLVEERIMDKNEIKKSDELIFADLQKRCLELIKKHPDKRKIFENYIKKQIEENDVLENKVICSTLVIRRK